MRRPPHLRPPSCSFWCLFNPSACRSREYSVSVLLSDAPLRRRRAPVDTAVGRRRVLVVGHSGYPQPPASVLPALRRRRPRAGVPTSLRARCTCPGLQGFWCRSVSDLGAAACVEAEPTKRPAAPSRTPQTPLNRRPAIQHRAQISELVHDAHTLQLAILTPCTAAKRQRRAQTPCARSRSLRAATYTLSVAAMGVQPVRLCLSRAATAEADAGLPAAARSRRRQLPASPCRRPRHRPGCGSQRRLSL